ncbi:GNAT family N-acetyltransferase [uncultured Ruminococcus sp.]|uniref:GNAT family N-acetyltransferase n=1 Tax=uncultured Ruminococcus sp. TaxID=165186 RepID=UPI0025F353B5|nr:GNAT family N-acetyltransferase [uncultured Ruminococcus sp.]
MKKLFDEIPVFENNDILIRRLTEGDLLCVAAMTKDEMIYRYEPSFLAERQYTDMKDMLNDLYGKYFQAKENLLLAIEDKHSGELCDIAEFYGFKDSLHKVCVGYRLRREYWGRGIATETVGLMLDYLFSQTDIEIVTASTMKENRASARVLEKNGFICTARSVEEDWGYDTPTIADKWFR